MRRERSKNKLTCFCLRKPLLAIWGNDEHGKPYIHIRIYKQGRIFGDVVISGGVVRICCRECLRWHRISFAEERGAGARLVETETPTELDSSVSTSQANSEEG